MSERTQAPPDDGADDLEILHPEREIEIAGRAVTVREYGGVEGMRIAGQLAPVVHDLASLGHADRNGDMLAYANLQVVFEKHIDAMLGLLARACTPADATPAQRQACRAWIDSPEVGDDALQSLLVIWWAVNGPFFVRRVVQTLQMRAAVGAFDGAKSMASSPRPGMATPPASDATRAVN